MCFSSRSVNYLKESVSMEGPPDTPSVDRVVALLEESTPDAAIECLDAMLSHSVDERKEVLRSLRAVADDRPTLMSPLCPTLTSFLTDDERSIRLSTAKLCVAIASADPAAVESVVDALAERLADDEEFYYVRARCAEALGYVGRDHPEAVSDPEILADFRIGLSFDEPEVKEKSAKALEYVALGDPDRLHHQVGSLAEHLDDENEFVRYHLTTALVAVGCEHPLKLHEARDALQDRLDDESPYVRGRAAEALGLLAQVDDDISVELDSIPLGEEDAAEFIASRRAFLQTGQNGSPEETATNGVGTLTSIREGTETVVEAMRTPDGTECPHCGLSLPDGGPPMCPRCGTPY